MDYAMKGRCKRSLLLDNNIVSENLLKPDGWKQVDAIAIEDRHCLPVRYLFRVPIPEMFPADAITSEQAIRDPYVLEFRCRRVRARPRCG